MKYLKYKKSFKLIKSVLYVYMSPEFLKKESEKKTIITVLQ